MKDKQTILQEEFRPAQPAGKAEPACDAPGMSRCWPSRRELDDQGQRPGGARTSSDYYLREQMHVISEELGDAEDTRAEADTYRRRVKAPEP